MAILAEQCRSPAALDWCERLLEIEPGWTNRLRLAAMAVRLELPPCNLALRALGELPDPEERQPAIQLLHAQLALKLGQYDSARHHLEAATRLEPQNLGHKVNLAVLDLHSTNHDRVTTARSQLQQMSSDERAGTMALQWLATDSLRRHEAADALRYSTRLKAQRGATLEDRLLYLSALQMSSDVDFGLWLRNIQTEAGQAAASLYAVSSWMLSHGLGEAALEWVTNCPARVVAQPPACLAPVDCLGAKGDWRGVERYLHEQHSWADWEFLRLAFLARAAFEQGQMAVGESHWRLAMRVANHQPGPQRALLNLAATWKNSWAEEELLWQVAQQFPSGRWAWPRLQQIYFNAGNTRGLNRLNRLMAGCLPADVKAHNNVAATSLLLGQDLATAHATARRLYGAGSNDPCLVSTYAYSLLLQGRAREGLLALEKLPPGAQMQPGVALYCGCLTAAAGDTNRAEAWFKLAAAAPMLPEERALLPAHWRLSKTPMDPKATGPDGRLGL